MNTEQKNLVTKNLSKLLEMTRCDVTFLSLFLSRNILDAGDVETIKVAGKNAGRYEMSKTFYDIILTRVGSYYVLLEALNSTRQTGALQILADCPDQSSDVKKYSLDGSPEAESTTPNRFFEPPDYICQFMNDTSKTILIVNSIDCKITCDRICETNKNCFAYTFEDFLNFIRKSYTDKIDHIPVVNCEGKVSDMIHYRKYAKQKCVIVWNYEDETKDITLFKVNEKILWKDLNPSFCFQIQKRVESRFGLESTECLKVLNNADTELVLQLINNEPLNLFQSTIPELVKYYIPRRLVTRSVISNNVFSHRGPDVFLISGVERHELSELASTSTTSSSSDIISGSLDKSMKFLVLDDDSHFSKVVKCAEFRPVHVLHYTSKTLIWIKSSGDIRNLQNFIVESRRQTIQNENDFLQTFSAPRNKDNDPVCISDSPGMGKSVLLTRLGKQLQDMHGIGSVGFLVISELVEKTKKSKQFTDFRERIFSIVAYCLCENSLGVAVLRRNKGGLKHLLLDGFDEVNESDVKFAYKLIKELRVVFRDTKIWITTRPHMLIEVENQLGVLGYNIEAFAEEDQVNFLQGFWSREFGDLNPEVTSKLNYVSFECLKSIKSKINTRKEEDIAGIPLQCLLIGEVFEDTAIEYCISTKLTLPRFKVKSIADLYQQLVDIKFNKFLKLHSKKGFKKDDLKREHIKYSISLLFPSHLEHLVDEPMTLSLDDIYNVGIIELKGTQLEPRFIHRTLAEFFVSLYILESLTSNSVQTLSMFFSHVLQTKPATVKIRKLQLETNEFRHNVICYFIDAYLNNYETIDLRSSSIPVSTIKNISEACVYGCFENLFAKLFCPLTSDSKYNQIYSEHFMIVCSMFAEARMCSEIFYNFINLNNGKPIIDIKLDEYTLLHLAVIRGNYSLVEHLVKREGFYYTYIISEFKKFSTLLHECVTDSLTEDILIVLRKKDIIRYFVNSCSDLLISKDFRGNLPILSSRLHPLLAKELLALTEYSIDIILQLLHNCLRDYKCEDLILILSQICQKDCGSYFVELWSIEFEGSCLLHKLFEHMEPDENLLNMLRHYGIRFCCDNDKQKSVLQTAVANQKGEYCIVWLLQNVAFTRQQLETAYIQAVRSLNIHALQALFDRKCVDVNVTVGNNNMLQILFNMTKNSIHQKHVDIARLLIGSCLYDISDKESLLCKFMISDSILSKQWWNLFDLLFAEIQTTPENLHLKKVDFMLRGINYEATDLFPLLRKCIQENRNNLVDSQGNSLLHLLWSGTRYCANVDIILVEVWKLLIGAGADPIILNKKYETPIDSLLKIHISNKYATEVVTYVLNNLSTSDIFKINNILILTVRRFRLDTVKQMCQWYTEKIHKPINDITGKYENKMVTMLDMALLSYDVDLLEYLLKTWDCKTAVHSFGTTWIHKCVEWITSDEKILKFITLVNDQYPNIINTPNKNGLVPLSMNIIHADYISHLLKLGANINAVDTFGNTPLHWAMRSQNYDTVKVLVEWGADVNAITADMETPLIMSIHWDLHDFEQVFKLLFENKADPSKQDSEGNTLLHHLPNKQFPLTSFKDIILSYILKRGYVDLLYLPNNNNMTPIQIAQQFYDPVDRVFKLIENYKSGDKSHSECQTTENAENYSPSNALTDHTCSMS